MDSLIKEVLIETLGIESHQLVPLLKGKGSINEFKLAEKLNISVNQIRNMLYSLESKDLVGFTRKKDKKKGWYVYYWSLNMQRIKDLIINHNKKKLEQYQNQLRLEKDNKYFICPNKCSRMNLENALEMDFSCPECESVLTEQDSSVIIKKIEKSIEETKKDIDLVNENSKEFVVKQKRERTKKVVKEKIKMPVKKAKEQPKKNIKAPSAIKKKRMIKNPIKLVKKLGKWIRKKK